MALFRPKRPIQLGGEPEPSRNSWSIPCCVNLSLYKNTPAIQLPQDSDNEQDDSEDESPIIFPQHLSGNPFARAVPEQRIEVPTLENFEQEQELSGEDRADEELADFSNKIPQSRYSDTEEDFSNRHDQEDYSETEEESIRGFTVQQEDDTTKDKVPQIEDDVLKMLPLPQLSMEIPPTMIHAFEESKYSQLPLMSTNLKSDKRVSRFSMSEEEYLAYKKKEEEEKLQDNIPKTEQKEVEQVLESSDVQVQDVVPESTDKQEQTLDEPLAIEQTLEEQVAIEKTLQEQAVVQESKSEQDQLLQAKTQQTQNEPQVIPPQQQETPEDKSKHVRRSSMAQSILGDKLDDFTEKLAFIKKNIIMSMDSEDEEDEEEVENAEQMLKVIKEQKPIIPTEQPKPPTLHRRASSLMDVAPSLARFMNQMSGEPTPTPSASSTFSPSSLFSAFAGPEPGTVKEEQEQEDDEEELFDFSKVLEIGKNVKSFGEGVVGMFNDVATRVKNSVEQEQQQQKQQQEASKPKYQRNESMSSTSSSTNNENEWMHNYL